jgi:tetratricopeptide (TPR) repeat protein
LVLISTGGALLGMALTLLLRSRAAKGIGAWDVEGIGTVTSMPSDPITSHLKGSHVGVLTYICAKHGFMSEVQTLLQANPKAVKYWGTADLLTATALVNCDSDPDVLERAKSALADTLLYAEKQMSPESKAVYHMNLAKIYLRMGETEAANASLQEALKLAPDIVSLRCKVDEQVEKLSLVTGGSI